MRPKKILVTANSVWNLVNFRKGLISFLQGHSYEVIAVGAVDGDEDMANGLGCEFRPIKIDSKGTNPIRDFKLYMDFRRVLKEVAPDVYLGFTIKPNIYGSLAARAHGVPAINTIEGVGSIFLRDNLLRMGVQKLYKEALRDSKKVFFLNASDEVLFSDLNLVTQNQIVRIPGIGINLNVFKSGVRYPNPFLKFEGQQGSCFRLLYLGRLLGDKGIFELIEAIRLLKARNFTLDLYFLGEVGARNPSALTYSQIGDWEKEGLVRYLGSTRDVRPYIANSNCIVLPSYREGLSRSLMEAAAMGKPAIATDVPGCREVVEHGITGYLCRPKDPHDLAAAIERMLHTSAQVYEQMGERARMKMKSEFDESLVLNTYADVIGTIVGH